MLFLALSQLIYFTCDHARSSMNLVMVNSCQILTLFCTQDLAKITVGACCDNSCQILLLQDLTRSYMIPIMLILALSQLIFHM